MRLGPYRGYNPRVNTSLSNEFATVGYRAHSMIHGEIEMEVDADRLRPRATLDALEAQGVEIARSEDGTELELAVPLNVAFFNPDLVGLVGLGPLLQGVGLEAEYRNDEQIDNQLRSVLFQIPIGRQPGVPGRRRAAGVLQRRRRPGGGRRRARPRPRHPDLQRAAAGVRVGAEAVVHRHHP